MESTTKERVIYSHLLPSLAGKDGGLTSSAIGLMVSTMCIRVSAV